MRREGTIPSPVSACRLPNFPKSIWDNHRKFAFESWKNRDMKFIQIIPFLACALVPADGARSQTSFDQNDKTIPVIDVEAPNVQNLWNRAYWHEENTGKAMQGEILETSFDFFERAEVITTANQAVWTLRIRVEDAPALCVYFDNFHLPIGSSLTFQSEVGRFSSPYVEGPIDYSENNDHGHWVSGEIPGEELVMRYSQPIDLVGIPELHINGIGYFFRFLWLHGEYDLLAENDRGSESCQVDIMCPEGDDWQCQRDAVVRLRVSQNGGIYLCSGAMVNNTAQDCKQLLLSSFHCADEVEDNGWSLLKVRYNYEHFECDGSSSFNSHVRTGVFYLTGSDDMFGNNINGSDFLLLEVEDPVFDNWTPFYAGWDVSGSNPTSGVGIHHPSGDRKKISTFTTTAANSSAYHPGAHWRVYWQETVTNHGVTEGGSSGSPLFDENQRIVGTLTGGASFCNSPNAPDYYGKMSYHWDGNNPISDEEKLYHFLDPLETNQEVLDGSYVTDMEVPCAEQTICGMTEVEEEWLLENSWAIRPNPARDRVFVDWSGEVQAAELRFYDAFGRPVAQFDVRQMAVPQANVIGWVPGMYYVTVETAAGATATRKLIID